MPDTQDPYDFDGVDLPPAVDEQIRKLSERAAAQLYPGNHSIEALKVSPAVEQLMRSIVTRHQSPVQEQIAEMGRRLYENSPGFRAAQEQLAETIQASLAPNGRWGSLINFSTSAAAKATSDPKLYPAPELDERDHSDAPVARKRNSPRRFFGKHAVTVSTVGRFLEVIATIQTNYSGRRLVWRGQQDANWPVQSSLHRHLIDVEKTTATEDDLVDYEKRAFGSAARWGIPTAPAMSFLSKLQHNGAPTRLLDVSQDPSVASWFAVEYDKGLESKPGRVIVWAIDGRDPDLPTEDANLFWHEWSTESLRRKFDWGTGTSMWPWFPPAAGNERMRAQRAGFLIGASSIVTTPVAELYSTYFGEHWNTTEIADATSFLGVPVPFNQAPSDADEIPEDLRGYVPFVTIHIPANFKRRLRAHLETTAGLTAAAIYPDLAGLVRDLRSAPIA